MKKNIAVLLIFPFIISILSIIVVKTSLPIIDRDIYSIEWNYEDYECFLLTDTQYQLKAEGVTATDRRLGEGNDLVWTVENADSDPLPHASIVKENGIFSLKPLSVGEVHITCANSKGTVFRRLTAIIYTDEAIVVQTAIPSSQTNIDPTLYVGTYDLDGDKKVPASLDIKIRTIPNDIYSNLFIASATDNIKVDLANSKVSILGEGDASFTLQTDEKTVRTFSFKAVDGVNVYSYSDLLKCTNFSKQGECVVLRKSFEALDNTYAIKDGKLNLDSPKADNVVCFGNYDARSNSYSFKNEVYTFKTTFNSSFIGQWNAFADSSRYYKTIEENIIVGLHVQKDFYGNGFTVNFHNLAYPYDNTPTIMGGSTVNVPTLSPDNLFRGPLTYFSMGNPSTVPLAALYGQDNIGMYIEGDGITLNDVNIKNCSGVDSLAFLDMTGTVVEAHGKNITVKNSVLSNGRNVLRAFSTDIAVKNCMLSYCSNFLVDAGSNEYLPIDTSVQHDFIALNGTVTQSTIEAFLSSNGGGNAALNTFIRGISADSRESVKRTMRSISKALFDAGDNTLPTAGNCVIEDCLFYKSGIASIGLETMFTSPYLITGSTPTKITDNLEKYNFLPCRVNGIGGIPYPVNVEVKGNTQFYEYKSEEDFIFSGMLNENISSIAQSMGVVQEELSLDDLFPIKSLVAQTAQTVKASLTQSGKNYCNLAVVKVGGGINLSSVTFTETTNYVSDVELDLLESFLLGNDLDSTLASLKRVILTVIGTEPFAFTYCTDQSLYGQAPSVYTLQSQPA